MPPGRPSGRLLWKISPTFRRQASVLWCRRLPRISGFIHCGVLEKKPVYQLNDADYEALLKIVEAEAGGEDENGKLLVANVVLNRVNSNIFPDTVTGVVYQKEFGVCQFSPVSDGESTG